MLLYMTNICYNNKDDVYSLGINVGFLAAFLLFASAFYFIMSFLNKIPKAIRYYHVLLLVIIAYFIGFAILKSKHGKN